METKIDGIWGDIGDDPNQRLDVMPSASEKLYSIDDVQVTFKNETGEIHKIEPCESVSITVDSPASDVFGTQKSFENAFLCIQYPEGSISIMIDGTMKVEGELKMDAAVKIFWDAILEEYNKNVKPQIMLDIAPATTVVKI